MTDYIVKRLLELIAERPEGVSELADLFGVNRSTMHTQLGHWAGGKSITSGKLADVTEALDYGWIAVPIGSRVTIDVPRPKPAPRPPKPPKQNVVVERQLGSAIVPSQNNETEK